MIIDSQIVGDVIDEITTNENLNDEEQDNKLAIIFSEHAQLRNHPDLIKPWESTDFKSLLQSYIKVKYQKEKVNIPNEFAEKVYVKAYNENIKVGSRFKLPLKILYHPYITKDDFHYVNNKIVRGQKLELYGSLSAVLVTSSLLYTTQWGRSIKNNPKQFFAFIGLPPILSICFAQIFTNYYVDYKLNQIGLVSKYGLQSIINHSS